MHEGYYFKWDSVEGLMVKCLGMIVAAGLWLSEGVAYVWPIHSAVQEKLFIETGSP